MLRILQVLCIVITAGILYLIGKSLDWVGTFFGPGFDGGFVSGMLFAAAVYTLICWIDPSSRPRGSSPKED